LISDVEQALSHLVNAGPVGPHWGEALDDQIASQVRLGQWNDVCWARPFDFGPQRGTICHFTGLPRLTTPKSDAAAEYLR
jgi:hypothetical protein